MVSRRVHPNNANQRRVVDNLQALVVALHEAAHRVPKLEEELAAHERNEQRLDEAHDQLGLIEARLVVDAWVSTANASRMIIIRHVGSSFMIYGARVHTRVKPRIGSVGQNLGLVGFGRLIPFVDLSSKRPKEK